MEVPVIPELGGEKDVLPRNARRRHTLPHVGLVAAQNKGDVAVCEVVGLQGEQVGQLTHWIYSLGNLFIPSVEIK
jgi:hypothetical protein